MENPAKTSHRGYVDEDYPPIPTKATRFWRRNLLWQAFRFFLLNYRIMRIVVKGHS